MTSKRYIIDTMCHECKTFSPILNDTLWRYKARVFVVGIHFQLSH
jgi:hypothetical protein